MSILGYKGLKKDSTCLNYKFIENVLAVHEGNIKICDSGFHFCKKLKDVFNYYNRTNGNIFAIVEIPDSAIIIDGEHGKSVTNLLKIKKYLSDNEIKDILYKEMYEDVINIVIEKYLPIQKRYPDTVCLGGSLSLILQNYKITPRDKFDMDLIIPYYMNMKEMLINSGILTIKNDEDDDEDDYSRSGSDVSSTYSIDKFKYENFISPKFKHKYVNILDKNGEKVQIKVVDPIEIWEAKIKYAIQSPKGSGKKHIEDILEAFENI